MDARLIVAIVMLLAGALLWTMIASKAFKNKGAIRMFAILFAIVLTAHSAISLGGQLDLYTLPVSVSGFFLSAGLPSGDGTITCPSGYNLVNGACISSSGATTYQPTATYLTKDKFSTTTVSGTAYYKINGASATTTAQTNVNKGASIKYWVSNGTYYVQPAVKTAGEGVTPVEATAYANGTVTMTLYDLTNRQDVTSGAYNTSMGANDVANIELSVQGTAKQSVAPFGGVLVAEYNSTLASVTCNGDVLTENPYHLTYTVTATTNVAKQFGFTSALDDGTASVERVTCQFKNGGTAVGAGAGYYFKIIPANYYVTNAGDIVLDTEQFANDLTTRTGLSETSVTGYWGS